MIDKVYVVSRYEFCHDLLDGFATNGAEIAQIVQNHWDEEYKPDLARDVEITVNLQRKQVEAHDLVETTVYYILAFDRAKI
jgi:hypothetical protein